MNGDLRIYPKSGYVVVALANLDPPAAQRITDYLDPRLPIADPSEAGAAARRWRPLSRLSGGRR